MNFFHGDLTGKKWGIDGDLVKKSMFHGDLVITGYVIRGKTGIRIPKSLFIYFTGIFWEKNGNLTGNSYPMGISRGKNGDFMGRVYLLKFSWG